MCVDRLDDLQTTNRNLKKKHSNRKHDLCFLLFFDNFFGWQRILFARFGMLQFGGIKVFDTIDEIVFGFFLFNGCELKKKETNYFNSITSLTIMFLRNGHYLYTNSRPSS